MRFIRDQFIVAARELAPKTSSGSAAEAFLEIAPLSPTEKPPGDRVKQGFWNWVKQGLANWVKDEKNRTAVLSVCWFLLVLVGLLLTAVAVLVSVIATSNAKPGIAAATVIWALLAGIVILFILPPKLVITTLGALLGIGINDVTTGAGLLEKLRVAITAVAEQISIIATGAQGTADPFITGMVWLFAGIVIVLCLPAFGRGAMGQ